MRCPGSAFGVTVVALLLLKPRVPERHVAQSVDQYWSTSGVSAKVVNVWFLLDGAGMLALIGCLLTGELVAAIVATVAIFAFWFCGPNTFAKE
jgi:hypothetical protein